MSDNQPNNLEPSKPATGSSKWTKLIVVAVVVVIVALIPLFVESPYILHIIILTLIYMIAAVSLRTIMTSGQFPLAHGAFMGMGAYLAGMAAKWLGWSPWLTIPASALVTGVIGMLIGYPFARLRTLYYAMGSLFFGMWLIYVIYAGGTITGGYSGFSGIPPLLATYSKIPYYYFFLGLTLLSLVALYRFEFSRIGINLKAIAQSHLVASSVGINESWYKILAVGVGCFFAGLAGAGYAHYSLVLSGTSFNFAATLWLVMYVLIGGTGSFAGPIIGTAILVLIPEFARDLKIYTPFISAAILLIVVFLMPKGLVSLPEVIRTAITARKGGKERIHAS
jgi:branched-chain amino acid transport system permease protein